MSELDLAARVATCLRNRRRPFTHSFDARIGAKAQGIYAFWLNSCCLYVGMSTTLRQRMYQHRMQEHNDVLDRYFKAFWRDIEASCVELNGRSKQDLLVAERDTIRLLRPRTNKAQVI